MIADKINNSSNKTVEIETVETKCKADIEKLENASALTWEGLDTSPGSLAAVVEWFEKCGTRLKTPRFYVTSGRLMNESYGLTGDNAYPDDLNIVSVMLDDIEDWSKIVTPRFETRGRWMDDIVDNNARRESAAEARQSAGGLVFPAD